ncbi:MAG: hypothetical protein IKK71_05185 [Clostridia bacterium]|nr:hypothetical protein [Clostridia bacterium]MBR6564811.1 hypothetical protein [Clostridia bacterium]
MTFVDTLRTLFEFACIAFIIWGLFNEKTLVAFEEKVLSRIRRKRLRVVKTNNVKKHIA